MDTPTPTQPPRRGALLSLPPLACLTWVSVLGGMRASRRKPMATNLFRRTIILPFSVVLGGMQGFDSLPPMDLPRSWTRPANHRRRGHVRTRRALPSEPAMPSGLPPEDRRLQPPARSHCDSHRITAYPSGPRPATSFSSVLRFPVTRDEDCHFFPPKPLPPNPPPPSRASEAYLGGVSCWRSGAAISPAGVSRRAGITVISVLFSVRGAGGGPFLAASFLFSYFSRCHDKESDAGANSFSSPVSTCHSVSRIERGTGPRHLGASRFAP